jgi:hypothetical protein
MLTMAAELVEVAYICLFSMRNLRAAPNDLLSIWSVLRLFWLQDSIERWYNAVFPRGVEAVGNLICLCPDVHGYHKRAFLAL